MTMHQRCLAYARSPFGQKWPDSIPYVTPSGRWIYGKWVVGALFKNATRYPGAYPRTYVERVRAMFPDVPAYRLLHAFAGSLPKGPYLRLDSNADLRPRPELIGSIYDLGALLAARRRRPRIRLVMADPPYPGQARKLYGTKQVETWRVFRTMAAALDPGAHVVWLSTEVPLYRKAEWHHYGSITLVRSTGNAVREVSIFERRAA